MRRPRERRADDARAAQHGAAGQAQAADSIQAAYRKAAKELRNATDNPQVPNEGIVAALTGLASAYGRLATAAQAEDEGAYESARRAVDRGKTRLKRALRAV